MKGLRYLKYALLCVYGAILIYLLFFMRMGTAQADFRVQLIPFRTLAEQISELVTKKPPTPALIQLGGNTLLFVPLGLLLPWCFPALRTWKHMALTALLMECAIELLQGITRLGTCDIDDLILNLLGITLGYILFQLLKRNAKEKKCVESDPHCAHR